MENKQTILNNLPNYYGTESYHKVTLFPILATDGVAYLLQACEAFWLIDEIGGMIMQHNKKWQQKGMVFFKLKKSDPMIGDDNKAVLSVDDGNGNLLDSKYIDYTDFPLDEAKIWTSWDGERWIAMLPSEY